MMGNHVEKSSQDRENLSSTSAPSVVDVLVAARKLIEKPENWTKEKFARNARGDGISIYDKDAVCWCAQGAIFCAGRLSGDAEDAASIALDRAIGRDIVDFNDAPERTHAEVLAAFDKAIELAKGQS